MTSNLRIDRPSTHVVRILLDRPDRHNAIDHDTRQQLIEAVSEAVADDTVRALVFGGANGMFSVGGDIASMKDLSEGQARARMRHGHELSRTFATSPVPIVTAIDGVGAGACISLALSGDYILVSPGARIVFPFLKLGLVPDWGMLRSLPLRIGLPAARRAIFEGRTLDGATALEIGLADAMHSAPDLADAAVGRAEALAQLPRLALARIRARFRQLEAYEADLAIEEGDQVDGLLGDEFREGFAAFTEKRRPNFTAG